MISSQEWRTIPEWDNYLVSDLGLVCRADNGKILKTTINQKGYATAHLRVPGKERNIPVHVAVLLAFIGPKPDPTVHGAHNDGNKLNNVLGNLRWASPKENAADKFIHGTQIFGEKHHSARLSDAEIFRIRKLRLDGLSQSKISALIGCSREHVSKVLRGIRRAK